MLFLGSFLLTACFATQPDTESSVAQPSFTASSARQPAAETTSTEPLHGITLESIEDFPASHQVIADSEQPLTVRLVMDAERDLREYQDEVADLSSVASVMVQLADSEQLGQLSATQYAQRATEAVKLFGDHVDIWEIGNELNGDWVGKSPAEINAKVVAAHQVITANGGQTALTLNYWSSPDCYAQPWEATLDYARSMPDELKSVDYIFLSVYETACSPPQYPTTGELGNTLAALGKICPYANLGIGEIGAQGVEDGLAADPSLEQKQAIAHRYYGMYTELRQKLGDRFVGGYFWWYFKRDVVDKQGGQSLLPALGFD